MTFFAAKFDTIYVFRHEKSEFEVHFETGSRINGVSDPHLVLQVSSRGTRGQPVNDG